MAVCLLSSSFLFCSWGQSAISPVSSVNVFQGWTGAVNP